MLYFVWVSVFHEWKKGSLLFLIRKSVGFTGWSSVIWNWKQHFSYLLWAYTWGMRVDLPLPYSLLTLKMLLVVIKFPNSISVDYLIKCSPSQKFYSLTVCCVRKYFFLFGLYLLPFKSNEGPFALIFHTVVNTREWRTVIWLWRSYSALHIQLVFF